MPIYGYQCQACGHEFEVMQKISDPTPDACPACGKAEIRKQLSAAGFQLKGKGWYATDFKTGGCPSGEKSADKDKDSSAEPAPKTGCGGGSCGCH